MSDRYISIPRVKGLSFLLETLLLNDKDNPEGPLRIYQLNNGKLSHKLGTHQELMGLPLWELSRRYHQVFYVESHSFYRLTAGDGPSATTTSYCSCGWIGPHIGAYNSYQHTMLSENETRHLDQTENKERKRKNEN